LFSDVYGSKRPRWTPAKEWHLPVLDLPGWEHIREAFVIGGEESSFEITKEDRRVLSTLLSNAKPPDLVIYEYALGRQLGQGQEWCVGQHQALEQIEKLKPGLVVLDISLKESNGIEVLKDIKAQYPKLLVLMLSMHDETLYALRVLRANEYSAEPWRELLLVG
jgi:CheY-like chemotaxis protein